MKITTWNVRGLNAPNKKRILKLNIKAFESDIILLQETKLNKIEGSNFKKRLGNWGSIFAESRGASGGLAVLWNKKKVSINIININNNWLCSMVKSIHSDLKFILCNIYGPVYTGEKSKVWKEISIGLSNFQNTPIILGGDFNTILNLKEKTGGINKVSQAMKDFNSWYSDLNLTEVPCRNGTYTWNNRRKDFSYIAEKLDRFFTKGELDINNLNLQTEILPYAGSDHFPVRLELFEPHKPTRNAFKCEKMWFSDPSFLENIHTWWLQGEFEGSKMFIFVSKIKMLKEKILIWNRTHFKNIFKEKLDIEEELRKLNQEIIRYGMDYKKYELEKTLLAKQEEILSKEEIFWKQKSREKWLAEGDRNSKYFHNTTKFNRTINTISRIKDQSDSEIDNPSKIAKTFVNYFQTLLNNLEGSNKLEQDLLLKEIPKILTAEDNKLLNQPFSLEEVKQVVFNLDPEKSPGPDGFQAFFYQNCWNILGKDLWEALEASRKGCSILSEINHSFICPKSSF